MDYARTRFVDVDVENTGRGAFGINKGLVATKAFTAATVFNVEELSKMDIEQVQSHLKELKHFNFIDGDMIKDAIRESSLVLNHARIHSKLPEINLKDHSVMQKGNALKKQYALKNILGRIRNAVSNIAIDDEDNEGYIVLSNNILPNEEGINELKDEQDSVTTKAYDVMEWWRHSGSSNEDTGIPRYVTFSAWGRILKLVALCVPSSAAVERVFSQLKLCLSEQRSTMLQDEIESSLLLRVNDVVV